jgi:hypothetical protein
LQQQGIPLDDFAAYEIRQSTVGEGDVGPALQYDDFAVFTKTSCAGGRTCAPGDSAYDYDTFPSKIVVHSDAIRLSPAMVEGR